MSAQPQENPQIYINTPDGRKRLEEITDEEQLARFALMLRKAVHQKQWDDLDALDLAQTEFEKDPDPECPATREHILTDRAEQAERAIDKHRTQLWLSRFDWKTASREDRDLWVECKITHRTKLSQEFMAYEADRARAEQPNASVFIHGFSLFPGGKLQQSTYPFTRRVEHDHKALIYARDHLPAYEWMRYSMYFDTLMMRSAQVSEKPEAYRERFKWCPALLYQPGDYSEALYYATVGKMEDAQV